MWQSLSGLIRRDPGTFELLVAWCVLRAVVELLFRERESSSSRSRDPVEDSEGLDGVAF